MKESWGYLKSLFGTFRLEKSLVVSNKLKYILSHCSLLLIISIYLRKINAYVNKDLYAGVQKLSIIAQNWKQSKCLVTGGQINKM